MLKLAAHRATELNRTSSSEWQFSSGASGEVREVFLIRPHIPQTRTGNKNRTSSQFVLQFAAHRATELN